MLVALCLIQNCVVVCGIRFYKFNFNAVKAGLAGNFTGNSAGVSAPGIKDDKCFTAASRFFCTGRCCCFTGCDTSFYTVICIADKTKVKMLRWKCTCHIGGKAELYVELFSSSLRRRNRSMPQISDRSDSTQRTVYLSDKDSGDKSSGLFCYRIDCSSCRKEQHAFPKDSAFYKDRLVLRNYEIISKMIEETNELSKRWTGPKSK